MDDILERVTRQSAEFRACNWREENKQHAANFIELLDDAAAEINRLRTQLVGVAIQVLGFDDKGEPIPFDDAKVTAAIDGLLRDRLEVERLRDVLTEIHNEVPKSWLDPILTGPHAFKVDAPDRQVEDLLNEIRARIAQKARAALRPADANKGGE